VNEYVEVVENGSTISVLFNGEEYLAIGVDTALNELCVHTSKFNQINWVSSPEALPVKQPARQSAIPANHKDRVRVASPKPHKSKAKKTSLSVQDREDVIDAVMESWDNHPEQSAAFTSQETRRIAREIFGKATRSNVMTVAGIRAAMTRGVYGELFE